MSNDDPFADLYKAACRNTATDIYYHLPKLAELALRCEHVTEFGVRCGESTKAFLYAATREDGPIVRSYDISIETGIPSLFYLATEEGANAKFIQGDTLKVNIEPTDLLCIDTNHTYEHLTAELNRHAHKVRRYFAFHDTYTCGLGRPDTEPRGLLSAIIDFVIRTDEWAFNYYTTKNNGLTVLHRIPLTNHS